MKRLAGFLLIVLMGLAGCGNTQPELTPESTTQASLYGYTQNQEEINKELKVAYEDVRAAFIYYLKNCEETRPLILAGFSQGGDMVIRLMKEFFSDTTLQNRLVATYEIGWTLTQEECDEYPWIHLATGEEDMGGVVTFNSEAEDVKGSFVVGENDKTLAINPLNWKTDSTKAKASKNKGACFTDYEGNITKEVEKLCGAYIDAKRGTLKVTGIQAKDYPAYLSFATEGVYHIYDYQFFYRNLQENVEKRVNKFI